MLNFIWELFPDNVRVQEKLTLFHGTNLFVSSFKLGVTNQNGMKLVFNLTCHKINFKKGISDIYD